MTTKIRTEMMKYEKITCKHCCKKTAFILKHIAKDQDCKSAYNDNELNALGQYSKSISNANKRNLRFCKYNSEDAADKYYINMLVKDQGEIYENPLEKRIECNACKRKLKMKSILNHIARSSKCHEYYDLLSSKQELESIQRQVDEYQKTRQDESKKKKIERLKHEKAERKIKLKQENIQLEKKSLMDGIERFKMEAQSKNENGMKSAKEEFDFELQKFKLAKISNKLHEKIIRLENSIQDTYMMFKHDIANIVKVAEDIARNVNLDYASLSHAGLALKSLFKPIWSITGYRNEEIRKYYTIWNDWHDIRLRIDLELNEIAKSIGVPFKWAFSCSWFVGVCPKCVATKSLQTDLESNENNFERQNSAPTLVQKRKPMNITIEDLEATNDDDSDFEAAVDTSSIGYRDQPKRKSTKKNLSA